MRSRISLINRRNETMEKKKNVSGSIQATSDIHNGIVAEDEFQRE